MILFLVTAQVLLGIVLLLCVPGATYKYEQSSTIGAIFFAVALICFLSAYHLGK